METFEEIFKGMQIVLKYKNEKTRLDIAVDHDEIHIGFDKCLEIMSWDDKQELFMLNWSKNDETDGFSHWV